MGEEPEKVILLALMCLIQRIDHDEDRRVRCLDLREGLGDQPVKRRGGVIEQVGDPLLKQQVAILRQAERQLVSE